MASPILTTISSRNRSRSSISIVSDAGSFHSAHTALPPQTHESPIQVDALPLPVISNLKNNVMVLSTPMSRADSGYSDGDDISAPNRRSSTTPSTSTVSSRPSSRRQARSKSTYHTHTQRPSTKRLSKSSNYIPGVRPARYSKELARTTSLTRAVQEQTYQFFQFPSFTDPAPISSSPPLSQPLLRPILPRSQTVPSPCHSSSTLLTSQSHSQSSPNRPIPHHTTSNPTHSLPPYSSHTLYWTSPETRRLEYAAIDAASKGLRGFCTRLVPDCILPKEFRRPKFSAGGKRRGEGDEGEEDDAGSVRRYRLEIEGEGDEYEESSGLGREKTTRRRRWSWWKA